AEDGIRDRNVTGVQTCALPISIFFKGVVTKNYHIGGILMNNQLIKSIRMSLHLNQNEFSKLIGVGRSELANIEAGYRDVSENLVRAIRENIDLEFIKK